jgi:hypothetical protein
MTFVYAVTTLSVQTKDGGVHTVHRGDIKYANDPVVLAAPHAFTEDLRTVVGSSVPGFIESQEAPVEQVTARPGERRAQVKRG